LSTAGVYGGEELIKVASRREAVPLTGNHDRANIFFTIQHQQGFYEFACSHGGDGVPLGWVAEGDCCARASALDKKLRGAQGNLLFCFTNRC
jgi:hypothetical protein